MILCYHAVDPTWESSLSVPPARFAQQCAWLASHRRVIGLDTAMVSVRKSGALPRGMSCITFDDGFASLMDHAMPVLERHGLPWTIFLVSGTLAPDRQPVDWIDDAPLTPPGTLTIDQILEMQERGATFGSHTVSHPDLTELSDEECLSELKHSREHLGDVLGREVRWLAYPRGRQTARVRELTERAGYVGALSLAGIPDCRRPFAVPRVGIYASDSDGSMRLKTGAAYTMARGSKYFPRVRSVVTRRPYDPRWTPRAFS